MVFLKISEDGTHTTPAFPAAVFADYRSLTEHEDICRQYEAARTAYQVAIRPAAVSRVVRALRERGYAWATPKAVRDNAFETFRQDLLAIPGFTEEDVQWHLHNPGKAMPCRYVLVRED